MTKNADHTNIHTTNAIAIAPITIIMITITGCMSTSGAGVANAVRWPPVARCRMFSDPVKNYLSSCTSDA